MAHRRNWFVVALLLGTTAYAIAEEIALTTYYPSPRGVYQELRTTGNTYLATQSGNVGIGTTSPSPSEKLDVVGGLRLTDDLHFFGASSRWTLHTPDDGRTSLYIAPWGGTDWDWSRQTVFANNGNVQFSGAIGLGTSAPNPLTKLHVLNGRVFIDNSGNNHALAPNNPALVVDAGLNEDGLVVRDVGATERLKVTRNGNVGIGDWQGVPPPLGALAVTGVVEGTITPTTVPLAAAAGLNGQPYSVALYASSGVNVGPTNNAAIAGIHLSPNGIGVYGEGNAVGVEGRGITWAGLFAGPVRIFSEPLLGTQGTLQVDGTISTLASRMVVSGRDGANNFWFTNGTAEPGSVFLGVNSPAGGAVQSVTLAPGGMPNGIFVNNAGNVGIGTATPDPYRLYVNGNARITGDLTVGGFEIADIAENMGCADCTAGDVVVVDPAHDRQLRRATRAYDATVAGVISEKPTLHIGGSRSETAKPLALAGQVKCKVTTENGPIKRGDLLVTSSTPGYAMRADPNEVTPGTLIGKALEPLVEGEGTTLVLITGG
ncbi:MAG: hypothetical protein HYY59_04180 [Candidatus Omnitrophica bacterium]|nr:hypothetical protein [Candidatus Omnitrophota bacterium]